MLRELSRDLFGCGCGNDDVCEWDPQCELIEQCDANIAYLQDGSVFCEKGFYICRDTVA
jgi:hypothetical protein